MSDGSVPPRAGCGEGYTMKMTLVELETLTHQWLDDPNAEAFDPTVTRLLVNEAYDEISNLVSDSPQPWFIKKEADAFAITPVANQREYEVVVADIHRITEVNDERTTGVFEPIDIVPYADRNRKKHGVYVFYASDGKWYMGIVFMPTNFTKLWVHYMPDAVKLTADNDVPIAVPQAHHKLIAYRAALLGKISENRDAAPIAALYIEELSRFTDYLGKQHSQHSARRLSA